MTILDSRGGIANSMLAKINGTDHKVTIKTEDPNFIPEDMAIKLSVWEGYGNFNKNAEIHATNIKLENETTCKVHVFPGTKNPKIKSKGKVISH